MTDLKARFAALERDLEAVVNILKRQMGSGFSISSRNGNEAPGRSGQQDFASQSWLDGLMSKLLPPEPGIDHGLESTITEMLRQSARLCIKTAIEAGATPDQVRMIAMAGALGALQEVSPISDQTKLDPPTMQSDDEDDGA